MTFADLHNHSLCGVDDGARSKEAMLEMIERSYSDGVRYLCLTPHYHPGYYGYNRGSSDHAFRVLSEICAEKYPDLVLALGNELHYSREFSDWLKEGQCLSMAGTRYLLVDFSEDEIAEEILKALFRIAGQGYLPILAHAERYKNLKIGQIRHLKSEKILIQVNAGSPLGAFGFGAKRRAMKIIKERLCSFISSDAHNTTTRQTRLNDCYLFLRERIGDDYAKSIFFENAISLIFDGKRKENK